MVALSELLRMEVSELEISVRLFNGLNHGDEFYSPIRTVAQLVRLTRADVLRRPNLGRISADEVERVLGALGLRLGLGDEVDTQDFEFITEDYT